MAEQRSSSFPPFRPSEEARRPVKVFFTLHASSPPACLASHHDAALRSWSAWLLSKRARRDALAEIEHDLLVLDLMLPLPAAETEQLERELQARLRLTPYFTIFSVVRADEAWTAPPLPLVLLHGLVDPDESRCSMSLLVRPIMQARVGFTMPSSEPIPLDALLARDVSAGRALLARLRRDSVVRLAVGGDLARSIAECIAHMPSFFAQPPEAKARMHCKLRPANPSCHQYAGVGSDAGREWIQLRRRTHGLASGVAPTDAPPAFAAAFDGLRQAAAACVRALAESLSVSPATWLNLTDLEDEIEGEIEGEVVGAGLSTADGRTCGPSVLRLYQYRSAERRGVGCHAHADLGMLTIAPAARFCLLAGKIAGAGEGERKGQGGSGAVKGGAVEDDQGGLGLGGGLHVFDPESLSWRDVELGLGMNELTLFCGEQLAFLSGGALPAPIHRVPPPPEAHGTRYSMPFFARAHPAATLTPSKPDAPHSKPDAPEGRPPGMEGRRSGGHAKQVCELDGALGPLGLAPKVCEEFVLHTLFRRRPWRPSVPFDYSSTPDY